MKRRDFLALGGASMAGLLAGCDARGEWARPLLELAERQNERLERALLRPRVRDHPAGHRPAGDRLPAYYVSDSVPVWDPAVRGAWRLEVSGLVRTPVRLDLESLMRLPAVTQRVNHYCVEGWTAVTEWTGVRVAELARRVEPLPGARYVDFESFDSGYHESWDLESALHPQTLIAYGYEGRRLDPRRGAPARLHSPVKLGYKSVKYLTRVVFLPERSGGYWSDRGYEWYAGT
ncbi:MAG: molybdopterin-dependent oxidoreductase [Gemmatimonadetes bacterium]|nr:molybdopterin-dependent oxidoreductase [Gemmatimonadota bacterium]NIQ56474.1 molybdopterin-dependent oxidoreductase [Gemmatimonadota bacterium]NIU76661.1 molybdopterin-dependent oxidoreductase [Gammaproteobacteria bacterium]NIX46099.1 molybdopterin-dependent oxidoreductase [Gemmatimonadota bacterium]NIY10414.1 molybdopterin-dependent oxidoreductase [Gemmatimonadota bacterium]